MCVCVCLQDLPFTYFFRAIAGAVETPLQSTPLLSQCLPGVQLTGRVVVLSVSVRDVYGGEASSTLSVSGSQATVTLSPFVPVNVTDFANQQVITLMQQLEQRKVSEVVTAVGTLSSWLTTALDPCAGVVCHTANSACFNGTCSCVAGYSGLACDVSTPVGGVQLQVCPGSSVDVVLIDGVHFQPVVECSGHGMCARTPVNCVSGTEEPCVAACHCTEGWDGSDCSYPVDALQAARDVRAQYFTKLKEAWNLTNPAPEAVSQQAAALFAVAGAKPDEVDTATQSDAVSFCMELGQSVGVGDTRSAGTLLETVTRLSRAASVKAQGSSHSMTSRRLGHIVDDVNVAQQFSDDVDHTVLNLVGALLNGTGPGEVPLNVQVRQT